MFTLVKKENYNFYNDTYNLRCVLCKQEFNTKNTSLVFEEKLNNYWYVFYACPSELCQNIILLQGICYPGYYKFLEEKVNGEWVAKVDGRGCLRRKSRCRGDERLPIGKIK